MHPSDAIYIGRGTPFGNPFKAKNPDDRDRVCDLYEEYLKKTPKLVQLIKTELKGKYLLCSCAPKRCHGDTLLRIANSE